MGNKVFYDHCVNEHNWGIFSCPNENCEFVSYSQFSYKCHTRTHIRENNGRNLTHRCTRKNCGKKFRYMSGLESHLKIHDNDVIRCFYCQWAGVLYNEYSIHMNTHFRNRRFKCQFCPQAFYDCTRLSDHIDIMHERDTEKYGCENCAFKTYSQKTLNYHKRMNCK